MTNALVHGQGDIEVCLRADRRGLRLEVADRGADSDVPALREIRPGQRGGWGLRLLDELADAWGAVAGPSETRVWMTRSSGGRDEA